MLRPSAKKRVPRKSLTKSEKAERAGVAEREERIRKMIKEQSERAIALRSKEREFHGLEREFMNYQEDLLRNYERAKDSKHPRDVGTTREQIIRDFLIDTGLLPKRFAISSTSVRAASTTGHISAELDLLFYDPVDSISLMRRGNVYEIFPVESTYGTIQVKSKVSRQDIRDGLQNIASYKGLRRQATGNQLESFGKNESQYGFGILFAFDTELDWIDLVNEVKLFSIDKPKHLWCNLIVVLTKGIVLHGDDRHAAYLNNDISSIAELQMHGRPDRQSHCLYNFYSVLLDLLKNTISQIPPVDSYFRLPFVAGQYSYKYSLGQFAEYGTCEKHGDYARKLTEEKLIEVIEWCKLATPINWIRATDIAYGKAGDDLAVYERQPGDVRIYNPDSLPFSEILLMECPIVSNGASGVIKSLAFDSIETEGMHIWIPFIYEVSQAIINLCPKCEIKIQKESSTTATA